MPRRFGVSLAGVMALALPALLGPAEAGAGPSPGTRAVWEQCRAERRTPSSGAPRGGAPLFDVATCVQGRTLRLGDIESKRGDDAAALRMLDAAPSGGLLGEHILERRAALAARLGRPHLAARLYGRLARRRGGLFADRAALARAELLLQTSAWGDAARQYRRLRTLFPRYPDPVPFLYGEANGLLLQGRIPQASTLLRRVVVDYPASSEAAAAGRVLAALRRDGRAIPELSPPELADQALRLGRTGSVAPALEALRALRSRPGVSPTGLALRQAQVLLANYRYAEAVGLLDHVRDKGTPAQKWLAQRRLPKALRRAGLLDRLVKRALAALQRRAGPEAHFELARVRVLRGEYREAAARLRRSGPGRNRTLFAAYVAFRIRDFRRAAKVLNQLEAQPTLRAAARYWLARTRYEQGRKSLAVGLLRELATATPLGYYGALARARLRSWAARQEPVVAPMEPLYRPPRWSQPRRIAVSLLEHRRRDPRLARTAALLYFGHPERALAELRVVARDYLLRVAGGARARFLRPISREEAYRGVRHLATPRLERGPPRPLGPRPALGLERALWRAFVALGDPYMANRFGRRGTDHPRLRIPRPYGGLVRRHARVAKLPPGWVWAIMTVESAYCAQVVSHAGALGLLQIMPLTGRRIAAALGARTFRLEQLFDPEVNIRYGVWYLGQLVRKFSGQLALAAAAYNGGPHNVVQWLVRRGRRSELDEFVEEIPLRETRSYVKRVIGLAARYAVELGEPYRDLVKLRIDPRIGSDIDF
ncbi:MAG: transglycosylase SLT domain-containing protein [bacterium]